MFITKTVGTEAIFLGNTRNSSFIYRAPMSNLQITKTNSLTSCQECHFTVDALR